MGSFVTLSEAKGLSRWADRCFAALSMTGLCLPPEEAKDQRRKHPLWQGEMVPRLSLVAADKSAPMGVWVILSISIIGPLRSCPRFAQQLGLPERTIPMVCFVEYIERGHGETVHLLWWKQA